MFRSDPTSLYAFIAFLVLSMAGIGLKVRWAEILDVLRQRGMIVRSLSLNFILVPLLGLLITRVIPMSENVATVLIILACAPGGLSAVQFASKEKNAQALAGALTFLLSFLSIVVSPALMTILLSRDIPLWDPFVRAIWVLLLFMLAPLVVGMIAREKAPAVAAKLAGPAALIGTVAFVVVVVRTTSLRKEATASLLETETAAIVSMIVATMVLAWLVGGPSRGERHVLAAASSMRNVALGFVVGLDGLDDPGLRLPLTAFAAIMIPSNFLLLLVLKVSGKIADRVRRRRGSR